MQHLDRNVPVQPFVASPKDLAHAALAENGKHSVRPDLHVSLQGDCVLSRSATYSIVIKKTWNVSRPEARVYTKYRAAPPVRSEEILGQHVLHLGNHSRPLGNRGLRECEVDQALTRFDRNS